MNINIENRSQSLQRIPLKKITSIIGKVLKDEKEHSRSLYRSFLKEKKGLPGEIDLVFVDNKEIKGLNKKYFQRDQVTDVIAFSMIEGQRIGPQPVLGDIIINAQIAHQDCSRFHHSFTTELLLLVIHAVLHILGYDHKGKRSLMRDREAHYLDLVRNKKS